LAGNENKISFENKNIVFFLWPISNSQRRSYKVVTFQGTG